MRLLAILLVTAAPSAAAQEPPRLPPVHIEARRPATRPHQGGLWPDSARRAIRDSLLAGRARWDKSRPRVYVLAAREFDSMVALYGPPKYETHMPAVVVHGDSIVGGVWARSTRGRYAQWLRWTVDSVFTLLEHSVRDSTRQIAVLKLHPTLGYPLEWNVDDSRNGWGYEWISDRGISGRVELLSVEPKYLVCRWWHRIRGHCWRLRSPA